MIEIRCDALDCRIGDAAVASWVDRCHTSGIKVAISIPDPIFAEAELLARRLQTSRDDIYARALNAFIGTHAPDRVTAAINQAVDAAGAGPDDFAVAASRLALDRSEW